MNSDSKPRPSAHRANSTVGMDESVTTVTIPNFGGRLSLLATQALLSIEGIVQVYAADGRALLFALARRLPSRHRDGSARSSAGTDPGPARQFLRRGPEARDRGGRAG